MPPPSEDNPDLQSLRNKIIGLGEKSFQKSYYPELQKRLAELERFRALLDQSTDCFFLIRCDSGLIEDVTEPACTQLGCRRSDLLFHPFEEYVAEKEAIHTILRDYCGKSDRIIMDTTLIPLIGKPISMEVVFSPVQVEGEHHFVAIARDNTERKQNEQAVQQLNITLERRVQERTRELERMIQESEAFSYSVSHDLRAPLRAITGFSQALLDNHIDQFPPPAQDYLIRIRRAAQRMTALIESLLSLSQITRASLNFRPVDLSALARIAIKDIVHQYPQRNIQFEVEEHLTAHGDANLLRIVLENLLGNAVKFTSRCDPALIHFGLVENDRKKIFYIRDNGAGFDMAYADKLFTPFKRLHAEAEFSGTGIGLSIVQRIITRHGGLIWAEAEIDKGAAFFFTLTES